MSVKVISFDTWEYIHDDAPGGEHGGTIDPATITYDTGGSEVENLNTVVVPCPFESCGSVSFWPSGGGADALLGQSLHIVMAYNNPISEEKNFNSAADQVKQRVIDTDGEERWVMDDAALSVLKARLGI